MHQDPAQATHSVRHEPFSRGYLVIHSAPSALTRHIQWAVANLLGNSVLLMWRPQPLLAGTYRTVCEWRDRTGTGAELASVLRGWHYLRFEIREEEPDATVLYRFTPELGIHRAVLDRSGAVMLTENQITSALTLNDDDLRASIARSLGNEWDQELEQFRRVELEGISHSQAI
jgi:hypothetical protein